MTKVIDTFYYEEALQNKRRSVVKTHGWFWTAGTLAIIDILSLFAAFFITTQVQFLTGVMGKLVYTQLFAILALALVLSFWRAGLYSTLGMNFMEELRLALSTTSYSFLILIGFTFLAQPASNYAQLTILVIWGLTLILLPTTRYLARKLFVSLRLWGESVVIIGDMDKAMPLASYFQRNPHLGIRPEAVLGDEHCSTSGVNAYPRLSIEEIKESAQSRSITTALLVVNDLNDMDALVDRYRFAFHRLIMIKYKRGKFGLNTLKPLDFDNVMGLQVKHNLLNPWVQVFKRAIDIAASSVGLLFLAPFLGVAAALIKLESPGGIFYRQQRLGLDGRVFSMLKFRTMHRNADQVLVEKLAADPALKKEWDQYQKLQNDPRITRVGAFLRKFSLDEFPQLWNVLIGEMSLVGPRPIMMNQEKMYGKMIDDYFRVAPGMTGLWQISGRNHTTFRRRAQLDNEYIQRWSLWMDIYILLATAAVVLRRDGAY